MSKNCKKKWKHEAVYLASYSKSQAGNHWFGQFDSRSFKADISFTFHALKMEYYFLQTFKDPRKPALCWTQETSLRLVLNCIPLTGSMTHQAPHLLAAWPCPNRHPTYQQHDLTLHLLSHQAPHLLPAWPTAALPAPLGTPLTGSMTLSHQAPHLLAAWHCPIRHPTYWQHDPVPSGTPLTGSMTLSHQAPHLPATWPATAPPVPYGAADRHGLRAWRRTPRGCPLTQQTTATLFTFICTSLFQWDRHQLIMAWWQKPPSLPLKQQAKKTKLVSPKHCLSSSALQSKWMKMDQQQQISLSLHLPVLVGIPTFIIWLLS